MCNMYKYIHTPHVHTYALLSLVHMCSSFKAHTYKIVLVWCCIYLYISDFFPISAFSYSKILFYHYYIFSKNLFFMNIYSEVSSFSVFIISPSFISFTMFIQVLYTFNMYNVYKSRNLRLKIVPSVLCPMCDYWPK